MLRLNSRAKIWTITVVFSLSALLLVAMLLPDGLIRSAKAAPPSGLGVSE